MARKYRKEMDAAKMVARNHYAWPGGYPTMLVMSDGGVLCPACVRKEFCQIARSTKDGARDGWAAADHDINWESVVFCDHCGGQIESAYDPVDGD